MDKDFWITFAALVVASCGPLFTALVNVIHEEVMYKKRNVTEHRHDAVERYLSATGRYAFSHDYSDLKEFGAASSEIFMYAPKRLWGDIKMLNALIIEIHSCEDYYYKKSLSTEIQQKYLELCEKFSDFGRKKHRNNRKSKDKN